MRRTEPPPQASWLLAHCVPGGEDEALAGDLLEEFRSGRSEGWYWRQVLAACAVSWSRSLRERMPLLAFALIWSMLAPAWKTFADGIENAAAFDRLGASIGPFWLLIELAGWMLLHAFFLWAGMLIYVFVCRKLGKAFHRERLRRSLLMAPLIFAPLYGVTFVLANLYWWDVFGGAGLAATPFGQIADLRLLADVLRIPYFIAVVAALWGALPQSSRALQPFFMESPEVEPSMQPGSLVLISNLDPFTLKRFFALMVIAGLMNAMIVGFLLCRLPESPAPTFVSLLIRAIAYVTASALAGVVGAWLYWKSPASPFREHAPIAFALFAMVCAAGWVWVPCVVAFSEQVSVASCFAAMIGTMILTSGLGAATYSVFVPVQSSLSDSVQDEAELFSESLYRPPTEAYGYLIAIGLYAAGWALAMRSIYMAGALLAFCGSLFVWKRTNPRGESLEEGRAYRQAGKRLVFVAIPAVLVTVWALLDGVADHNRVDARSTMAASSDASPACQHGNRKATAQSSSYDVNGYQSLILWPFPENPQIVPPIPQQESLLAPGTTQPITIPFNGSYRYVQPPNKLPGLAAHQAHGTPLDADIESNNFVPLVMDAHQTFGAAIPVARCREIQIQIENRDNRAGAIAMAVLLTDTVSPSRPTLYLEQQPILSTEPAHFSFKPLPVFEMLRFPIPEGASMRRFNEITVMMLPDVEHALVGPKIAIQQFKLLPR